MKRALLFKELRSMRPFLWIVLAFVGLDTIDAFLVPFEAKSFAARLASLSHELTILQIVLGFALGSSLLVREVDDGTLHFLDGLPLTRTAIFGAKLQAALLVLLIQPLGQLVLNVCLHFATRQSLDYAVHPSLLLTFLGLSMLVTLVSLTAGMLFGFLRHLAWLVLVLCGIGIKLLEDEMPSLAAALNTTDLLTLRFSGTEWQLPWPTIWTQLAAAVLFCSLAYLLFRSAGHVLGQVQRLHPPRRLYVVPLAAMMLVAGVAGLVLLRERTVRDGGGKRPPAANAVEFTPIASGQATTTHYTFSYPALSSTRVRPLLARADPTFKEVSALLGMEPGTPIDVDLSGSTDNHDGTAYPDRIRMHVRGASSIPTLAHETAHVLAWRLSGGERAPQLKGMMVFNEGLAEWIEGKFKNQDEASIRDELVGAIVSARRLVTPQQLTDQATFSSAVDQNLKYPLGAILIDRFIERYGLTAPNKLLLALASEDFPRGLSGYPLWQTAFQLAGFDLDLVLDDYARHLEQLERKHAQAIAELPRPRGSLVKQGARYDIVLRFDGPVSADRIFPIVRFRNGNSNDSSQYRTSYGALSPDGKFSAPVPGRMGTRGEVCFQPGVMLVGMSIYEPWVCLPVSSASGG